MSTPHDETRDTTGTFVPETDVIGRIATPGRVAVACVPIVLMTITPLLPFATTPTTWFGMPAVLVWVAALVVLTVRILQVIDRRINHQATRALQKGAVR
jgi:hypothetical protein